MCNVIWYPGYDLSLPNIVKAENCYLFDAEGKRYIDLEAGVWCTSIGHCHPQILRTLKEQTSNIAHTGFNFSNEIVETAAKDVLSLHGFEGGKCIFLCSGSEAVEFGVRTAQSVIAQPMLMTMADSYFGAYGAANMKLEHEWFCFRLSKNAKMP